jgi:folate-binding protein YgfZ
MSSPASEVIAVSRDDLERLHAGSTVIPAKSAIFRLAGPGVLECLQGILTNDVKAAGTDSLIYGAILTPKGMIVVDVWVFRDHDGFTVVAPKQAHQVVAEIFAKRFPPRLVTVKDHADDWRTAWLAGSDCADAVSRAGSPFPSAPWKTVAVGDESLVLGRLGDGAPWSGILVGQGQQVMSFIDRLQQQSTLIGTPQHHETLRIMGGWPGLGTEIGEKTLPQEVRFDEIGGVSHTKGCYVGQETVARIHFRGHPNRTLRGVVWKGPSFGVGTAVFSAEKVVGRLTSVLEIDDLRIGLSLIRREVLTGDQVSLGAPQGVAGAVRPPPFWDAAKTGAP